MKYKISNTSSIKSMENFTGLPLKYPKLYVESPVISGFQESIVPILTSEHASHIDFGIWGLLPDAYDEDWGVFQSLMDTQTINMDSVEDNMLFNDSLNLTRCVVIVTGFFTTFLHEGKTYPYYVHQGNKTPFYLAGYCNQLNDGFITFAIVVSKAKSSIQKVNNLSDYLPKTLTKNEKSIWLSKESTPEQLSELINEPSKLPLKYHTIARELYKMGITYSSMLEPVIYKGIPSD